VYIPGCTGCIYQGVLYPPWSGCTIPTMLRVYNTHHALIPQGVYSLLPYLRVYIACSHTSGCTLPGYTSGCTLPGYTSGCTARTCTSGCTARTCTSGCVSYPAIPQGVYPTRLYLRVLSVCWYLRVLSVCWYLRVLKEGDWHNEACSMGILWEMFNTPAIAPGRASFGHKPHTSDGRRTLRRASLLINDRMPEGGLPCAHDPTHRGYPKGYPMSIRSFFFILPGERSNSARRGRSPFTPLRD